MNFEAPSHRPAEVPVSRHETSAADGTTGNLDNVPAAFDPKALRAGRLERTRAMMRENDLAAVVGAEQLYEYADPLAGLVINVLQPGCAHPWHFDNNDFIVTLMTQQPEAGGAFEYCPQLRSAEDQNYPGVEAVLDGERGPVETLDLRPGDLQIFFGRNSLHRVAEVEGGRERHTLILAYAETVSYTHLTLPTIYPV